VDSNYSLNLKIPDFLVHYSRGEPFRSLSGVPRANVKNVLSKLNETNAWGLGRFSDPEYLKRRLAVEQKLRREFIVKGGKPVLEHPIYFFLGNNAEFEKHEGNKGYLIRLEDLPKDAVSFTYGDSIFSFNEDYRKLKGEDYLSELCPHVYGLKELPNVFSHKDYQSSATLHIEAQLWIAPTNAMIS
jgi:hypothetical protein